MAPLRSHASADVRAMVVICVATISGVAPSFFLGALFPEMGDDLGYAEFVSGVVVAAFFGASALLSAPLGERIDRWGPFRSMRVALVLAGVSQLLLSQANAAWQLGVVAFVAGAANAGVQIASNVFIAREIPAARQGSAFALKQSAMPAAALLAGGSLAAVAITWGWRVVFVAGAVLALATAAAMSVIVTEGRMSVPETRARIARPVGSASRSLAALAFVSAAGASSVVALSGFFVDAAIDAGIKVARAGLLLSIGGVVSIVCRLIIGRWSDRVAGPVFGAVAAMMGAGAVAFALFATENPVVIWCAVPVAFGAGWGWPGVFNLSVIRDNADQPGLATGRTQTGTYIGATVGPFVIGYLAEAYGYGVAWWVAAGAMGVAAAVCWTQRARPASGIEVSRGV